MSEPKRQNKNTERGFTLIEAVLGIALLAIAILGLAEVFTLSVLNNLRSDRITNASFLAQQQVDSLRTLTVQELADFHSSTNGIDLSNPPDGTLDVMKDGTIDLNGDGKMDYRRLVQIQPLGTSWEVEVLVFSSEQLGVPRATLLGDPARYRVRARMSTIISR